MKPHRSRPRTAAMTLTEVLLVSFVLALAVALLLPGLAAAKKKHSRLNCASNLKQVGIAFRLWEGDNNDKYPMAVSVTNGGAMELVTTGNVAACFRVMSNELSTPKILICPKDTHRVWATNFSTDFDNSHISYFVGLDAEERKPQTLLSGDDNFVIGGVPAKSGLLELSTNIPVAWASERHSYTTPNSHFWTPARYQGLGNLGMADGMVLYVTTTGLQEAVRQTGLTANRLALP